ncbi:MAG: hypothetical protein GY821_10790 [Gammaproteobacteria bacterium]|nr:hypothetical protein [Gammaproteobacteria bacterium]
MFRRAFKNIKQRKVNNILGLTTTAAISYQIGKKINQSNQEDLKIKSLPKLESETVRRYREIVDRRANKSFMDGGKIETGMYYLYIGDDSSNNNLPGFYAYRYPQGFTGVTAWFIALDEDGNLYLGITTKGANRFDRIGGNFNQSGAKAKRHISDEYSSQFERLLYQYAKSGVKNPLTQAAKDIGLQKGIRLGSREAYHNFKEGILHEIFEEVGSDNMDKLGIAQISQEGIIQKLQLIGPAFSYEYSDTPYVVGNFLIPVFINAKTIGELPLYDDEQGNDLCFLPIHQFHGNQQGKYGVDYNGDKRSFDEQKFQGCLAILKQWLTSSEGAMPRLPTDVEFNLEKLQETSVLKMIAERIQCRAEKYQQHINSCFEQEESDNSEVPSMLSPS